VEIDEVAARLVRRYWTVVMLCVLVPIAAVSLVTLRQPPLYAADARIITSSVVPSSSAESAGIVSQVQGIATSRSVAAAALLRAGASRNLTDFINNNISVTGLGSSQVVDLTVTDGNPQVARTVAGALASEVTSSVNRVGQSGLKAALIAIDDQIVKLSQERAALAQRLVLHGANQQLQAKLAGLDEVIANFTGDRGRLLIEASTQGLATVIDAPAHNVRPESKALPQKLGLAGLLGLVAGILIASLVETIRPTVPGAQRVGQRLGAPLLGQLSAEGRRGVRTADLEQLALRVRLAAAHLDVSTVVVTDLSDGGRLDDMCHTLQRALPRDPATGRDPFTGALSPDIVATGSSNGTATEPAGTATARPATLLKNHSPAAGPPPLRIYPLGRMNAVAGTGPGQVGLLVLAAPVTKASDVAELADLATSSGWPVLGVAAVPRRARRMPGGSWRTRQDPPVPPPPAGNAEQPLDSHSDRESR
jgi:capsular polysaccharide biosynthesis protein